MPVLKSLAALEILDSRGRPTLQATASLDGGITATAQVPSGASTGQAEAHELRDGDPGRHAGLGCRRAVASVTGELQSALCGIDWPDQESLDRAMIRLDGTSNKSRLGANAILSVSLAFARACARANGVPLYRHFARVAQSDDQNLPRPTINLFSGGKHAGGQVAIQDVLVLPARTTRMDDALAQVCAVFNAASRLCTRKYGTRNLVADEGGLAPPFPDSRSMLTDAVQSIQDAGLEPGQDILLAVDVASSHFYQGAAYQLDGRCLDRNGMIRELEGWLKEFPVVSLEDGLYEEDWDGWPLLTERLRERALILVDDFLCSHPDRIRRAGASGCATALLLKVNQIGTLTEALEARNEAKRHGWHVTVSARSGETEDTWLADLAVGWGGDHIKIGSITRSERLAKYNRLLEIESETGWRLRPSSSRFSQTGTSAIS